MSVLAGNVDLVEEAERRARVAALLGRLLASEPSADLADLVADIPALAPLASGDPALAADYERLLLRAVPLYESVFLGADGQRGGPVTEAVVELYRRHDFVPDEGWRVAGPDHLGVELACYAALCREESAGWAGDQPDRATRAVEAARELLAVHLGQWGEVAMAAVRQQAGDPAAPYGVLADAVARFLAAEANRLRPNPDHPGWPPVEVPEPPRHLGPARLARWLLAPATCGAFLDAGVLAEASLRLGIPWRPSDPRGRLRQTIEAAVDGGDLADLLSVLRPAVEAWRDHHAAHEATRDGDRRTWTAWRLRAEHTLALIDRLVAAGGVGGVTTAGPVLVTVDAGRAAAVVERLRPLGVTVAVSMDLRRLAPVLAGLLDAGAEQVLLNGGGVSALAIADGGEVADREARHLDGADIVVRVAGEPRSDATVEGGGPLAERVRDALAAS